MFLMMGQFPSNQKARVTDVFGGMLHAPDENTSFPFMKIELEMLQFVS
jgi:hypothetical protein